MRNLARELTIGALLLEIASGCAAPSLSTPPAERPHGSCVKEGQTHLVIQNGENAWAACKRKLQESNLPTDDATVSACVSTMKAPTGESIPTTLWAGDETCVEIGDIQEN